MSVRTRTVRLGSGSGGVSGLGVVLVAVLGLIGGGVGAPWAVAHTEGRTQLNPDRYQLVVPGVKATGASLAATAKSGLADGKLVLETRAFGAPERLVPQVSAAVALDLELAADSDPVLLNARTSDGNQVQVATLGPDGWLTPSGETRPYSEPGVAHVTFSGGKAWVDGVATAQAAGGGVEISPLGHAGLRRLRLTSASGAVLLEDDFAPRATPVQRAAWALGAALGAVAALLAAARSSLTTRVVIAAEASFALVILAVPYGGWMAVVERLYLAQLDVGALRRFAFAAALVPLGFTALRALGVLDLQGMRPPPLPRPAAAGIVGVLCLAACRDLTGWGWFILPIGVLLAVQPWRTGRELGQPVAAVLLRDLPALLAPAILGWGPGLLPAVAWRFLTLGVDAPHLLRKTAGAGADALLLLVLAAPLAAETALRSTSLDHSWDPTVLAGASVGGPATVDVSKAFWEDTCGAEPRARVYAFGGSSTGGAWQFRGDASAFFPTRLHEHLCAAGHAVHTLNFGEGGRDSFDVAQGAPALFDEARPTVVILYLGVNDLLTHDSPLTRKQRAALLAARSETVGLMDRLSSGSRLFTGLGLLVRPHAAAEMVAAVPLADAEENVRAIAASVAAHGGRVVFVPELTRSTEAEAVQEYAAMLTRLGQELPGTTTVDVRTAIGADLDGYMTDRNHLSREGGAVLARTILPAVEAALADTEPR